jgi:BolA protein
MQSPERIIIIRERLQAAFSPEKLDISDDSAAHVGHVGSQGGAGHYTVMISASCFKDMTRVAAHRVIYDCLADLIPEEIHALQIKMLA